VCELLSDYIADLAIEDATKGALPAFEQYRRWVSTAQSLRRSLGIEPMNRPGFDAASFFAKDADHAEEVSARAA
jgi:hypothetical protein